MAPFSFGCCLTGVGGHEEFLSFTRDVPLCRGPLSFSVENPHRSTRHLRASLSDDRVFDNQTDRLKGKEPCTSAPGSSRPAVRRTRRRPRSSPPPGIAADVDCVLRFGIVQDREPEPRVSARGVVAALALLAGP